MKPLVGIIDWITSPLGKPESRVERDVIGDDAQVCRFLCASDADFNDQIVTKCDMRTTSARIARAAVLGLPLENVVNGMSPILGG